MGVVYKAEDERLHRAVALKVLPPDSNADEERRLRFLPEARAAASLTHPNIASIYEVDESDGNVFIAMESIEGKMLRSLMAGRSLAVKEALRISLEVSKTVVDSRGLQGTRTGNGFGGESSSDNGSRAPSLFS